MVDVDNRPASPSLQVKKQENQRPGGFASVGLIRSRSVGTAVLRLHRFPSEASQAAQVCAPPTMPPALPKRPLNRRTNSLIRMLARLGALAVSRRISGYYLLGTVRWNSRFSPAKMSDQHPFPQNDHGCWIYHRPVCRASRPTGVSGALCVLIFDLKGPARIDADIEFLQGV